MAQDDLIEAQKTVLEKMNRIANKSAKRVSERLQRYDSNHGIFTK